VPIKIWAYGSRVNGQAHDASDLDLVLITKNEKPVPIDQFIAFKETIIESNIPILVQVVDWYRIPENFQKNIEKNYIELYTNDNQSKT
jgi:predicted nucleotidyltransferase